MLRTLLLQRAHWPAKQLVHAHKRPSICTITAPRLPALLHARCKSTAGVAHESPSEHAENAEKAAEELEDELAISALAARNAKDSRPELVVKRPSMSTFTRDGFPKELLKWFRDFPHALLLVRVGQFYESYFDQALEVANLLKIRLTSKSMESKRYPMCGFPIAHMDKFLEKLVREHGKFVAICEETKEFDKAGNLKRITRGVVRVVTPGTLVDEAFIEKQSHNYLLAIACAHMDANEVELAWIDTSTGELFTQGSSLVHRALTEDLARIAPAEIVLPAYLSTDEAANHPIRQAIEDLDKVPKVSYPVKEHSATADSLDDESTAGFSAIPLLSDYISETLLEHQPDLTHPLRVRPSSTMRIDRVSLKALEIKQNNDGGRGGTLISVLDRTVTSAGMRLLGDRISAPSKSLSEISSRLSLVASFIGDRFLREEVIARLHKLDDEARLLQKMSIGRPTAEDLLAMARAIRVQTDIKQTLESGLRDRKAGSQSEAADLEVLQRLTSELEVHDDLAEKIEAAIDIDALESERAKEFAADPSIDSVPESVDDTEDTIDIWNIPMDVVKGKRRKNVIKPAPPLVIVEPPAPKSRKALPPPVTWGKQSATVMHPNSSKIMSKIYDNIRRVEIRARRLQRELLKQMEAPAGEVVLRVIPRFGPIVYVGWRRTHPPAMRTSLAALQEKGVITLIRSAASARYFSHTHWTKLNSEMQGLLVQLREAENSAIRELCNEVLTRWHSLRRNAAITAELDVATALAKAAQELNLIRPVITESNTIRIEGGRHPVAEYELAKQGRGFVSNDLDIDGHTRLHVITGPNMGGKSTVLRQVGIIAAMAQAGSFVPADRAEIGIIDQVFARIRYSDNIARGRSSFRVEMDDAAYILHNATDSSLVLLDEFGRGTTADYAACIAESTIFALVHDINARSLFATHLHDIYDILHDEPGTGQGQLRDKVSFWCTQLAEEGTDSQTSLRYLYKLAPGVNRDAAAFKVAEIAGYPEHLLERATSIYEKRNMHR